MGHESVRSRREEERRRNDERNGRPLTDKVARVTTNMLSVEMPRCRQKRKPKLKRAESFETYHGYIGSRKTAQVGESGNSIPDHK